MGLIYMISLPNSKKYVGQHKTNNLEERKKTHLYQFKYFCKKKEDLKNVRIENANPEGFCSALYNAFKKYGFDKCTWTVLETDVDLGCINDVEDKYIIEHKTLHPGGYNLKLNKNSENKSFSDETLKKMSESQSKVFKTKLHKYRRNNKELEGLPKHVNFITKDNDRRGFRIVGHPKYPGKSKTFTSSTLSIKALKKKVIKFLEEIEGRSIEEILKEENNLEEESIEDIIPAEKESKRELPVGIRNYKTGYKAIFVRNKKSYSKSFTDESNTKEQNLQLAIDWYKNTKLEDVAKKERDLPKGISKCRNGYRSKFVHKGKTYAKTFTDASISDDEKIKLATDWLQNKKSEILNIKEEGSETK